MGTEYASIKDAIQAVAEQVKESRLENRQDHQRIGDRLEIHGQEIVRLDQRVNAVETLTGEQENKLGRAMMANAATSSQWKVIASIAIPLIIAALAFFAGQFTGGQP